MALDLVRILNALKDYRDLTKFEKKDIRWAYKCANQLRIDIEDKIAVLGVKKKYRKKRIRSARERLLSSPFRPRKKDIWVVDCMKKIILEEKQNNKNRKP